MRRWLKRLLVLLVIGAGSGAVVRVLKQRQAAASDATLAPSTEWPPFTPSFTPSFTSPAPDWVTPVDGACPDGYPIKANDSSHIFHVPGGRFYARTVPERCYASADAATRDGYRQAKA